MIDNNSALDDMYPSKDINSFNPEANLVWYPTLAPYPLRSTTKLPLLDENAINQVARASTEYHCHLFDLTKPAEVTLYETIKQRIINGWYAGINEMRKWKDLKPITAETSDEDMLSRSEGVLVWLEWTQTYMEIPGGIDA